jgi:hypothetical protein
MRCNIWLKSWIVLLIHVPEVQRISILSHSHCPTVEYPYTLTPNSKIRPTQTSQNAHKIPNLTIFRPSSLSCSRSLRCPSTPFFFGGATTSHSSYWFPTASFLQFMIAFQVPSHFFPLLLTSHTLIPPHFSPASLTFYPFLPMISLPNPSLYPT